MKTNTHQLIEQAARELELENLTVEPDLEKVGLYVVKWKTLDAGEAIYRQHETSIPMAADYKGIVKAMKAASKAA